MKSVSFGSLCDLRNGRAFKPEEWSEQGTPIVRIQNLNDESKPFNYCNFEVEEKFWVNTGDLLFSWSGTPGTSFGAFFWNRGRGFLNQHIFRVDINEALVDKAYLRYALNSLLDKIIDQSHGGVGLKHITKAKLESVQIPLPPLPEQRRIAAILDKADALRAKRREAIAKLDQLLQSVFLEMFGDPVKNPNGVTVMPLGDVATQVTDGAHHTPERTQSGIPLLSARNVLMGSLSFSNTDFVGQEEYERLRRRCEPKKGDILISCSGSIGRVSVVRTDIPFVLVRSAALVKLDQDLVTPTFMEHQLRTPYLQGQMQMSARSSSQANLFQKPIRELKVLVPPIALQKRFEAIASKVAERHSDFLDAEKRSESLFTSLQAHAFSGKLFP